MLTPVVSGYEATAPATEQEGLSEHQAAQRQEQNRGNGKVLVRLLANKNYVIPLNFLIVLNSRELNKTTTL